MEGSAGCELLGVQSFVRDDAWDLRNSIRRARGVRPVHNLLVGVVVPDKCFGSLLARWTMCRCCRSKRHVVVLVGVFCN